MERVIWHLHGKKCFHDFGDCFQFKKWGNWISRLWDYSKMVKWRILDKQTLYLFFPLGNRPQAPHSNNISKFFGLLDPTTFHFHVSYKLQLLYISYSSEISFFFLFISVYTVHFCNLWFQKQILKKYFILYPEQWLKTVEQVRKLEMNPRTALTNLGCKQVFERFMM